MDLALKKQQESYKVSNYTGADTEDEFYNITTFAKNMVVKDSKKYNDAEYLDEDHTTSISKWLGQVLVRYFQGGISYSEIEDLYNFVVAYNEQVDAQFEEILSLNEENKTVEFLGNNTLKSFIEKYAPGVGLEEYISEIDGMTNEFDESLSDLNGLNTYSIVKGIIDKEKFYISDVTAVINGETEKTGASIVEQQLARKGSPLVFFDFVVPAEKVNIPAATLSRGATVDDIKYLKFYILYKELNPLYRKDINSDSIEMSLYSPYLSDKSGNSVSYPKDNFNTLYNGAITSVITDYPKTLANNQLFTRDICEKVYTKIMNSDILNSDGERFIYANGRYIKVISSDNTSLSINDKNKFCSKINASEDYYLCDSYELGYIYATRDAASTTGWEATNSNYASFIKNHSEDEWEFYIPAFTEDDENNTTDTVIEPIYLNNGHYFAISMEVDNTDGNYYYVYRNIDLSDAKKHPDITYYKRNTYTRCIF